MKKVYLTYLGIILFVITILLNVECVFFGRVCNGRAINNQFFLDFIPYSNDGKGVNSLLQIHNVYAHSLVKLDVLNSSKISIKWLTYYMRMLTLSVPTVTVQTRRKFPLTCNLLLIFHVTASF